MMYALSTVSSIYICFLSLDLTVSASLEFTLVGIVADELEKVEVSNKETFVHVIFFRGGRVKGEYQQRLIHN